MRGTASDVAVVSSSTIRGSFRRTEGNLKSRKSYGDLERYGVAKSSWIPLLCLPYFATTSGL